MLKLFDVDSLDNRDPVAVAKVIRFIELTLARYHRAEVRGVEGVPPGGALYVGNHNSFTYTPDSYLFGAAVYRAHGIDAVPYGLAHGVALKNPIINRIIVPLGAMQSSLTELARQLSS